MGLSTSTLDLVIIRWTFLAGWGIGDICYSVDWLVSVCGRCVGDGWLCVPCNVEVFEE